MNYTLINDDVSLHAVCQSARQYHAVALDTEFVRTRTYYPCLGLIQLYDSEKLSLIDPLLITDWSPFVELLKDDNVIKYLHASSEDLDVFLREYGVLPGPMIDSQIMAAFTGRPLSWGFAAMVNAFTGITLDKSEARTDWLARPLTASQCEYAAGDVAYLLPIAQQLQHEVSEAGWSDAVREECELLCHRRSQVVAPQDAWQDISQAWKLNPRQLAALQLLAAWRLNIAREQDSAINFILHEEHLWKIARYTPGSLGELEQLGLSGREIRYYGKTVLELVKQAEQLSEASLPEKWINLVDLPDYKRAFSELKAIVRQVSETCGLSPEFLASRRQINQLLSSHWRLNGYSETPVMLQGWRRALMKEKVDEVLSRYK